MVDTTTEAPVGFNPLEAANRLKAVGCESTLAEAIIAEIVGGQGGLVTKGDLRVAVSEMRTEMAVIRTEISNGVVKLMATMIAVGTLAVAAIKYLP